MILYTPVAWSEIFPAPPEESPLVPVTVSGRLCLARRRADGALVLERLLSTDPRDYLDPRFQPQSVLNITLP
ncbi:MAG: YlzJ-like family protein [Firmicutes bacterium]|nr:YlzJ-like family protein [Bacillota bacterium]